jgi:hypothetical protein
MQRRQVVRTLALLTAGAAGCSEAPSPTPAPPEGTPSGTINDTGASGLTTRQPMQTDFSTLEGPDGNLQIDISITNPAELPRRVTLLVTARLDDEARTASQTFDLDRDETATHTFTIAFDYDRWLDSETSIDFDYNYR